MHLLDKLRPISLLLLRAGLGVIFILHGYPKLFTEAQRFYEAFVRNGFPGYLSYAAGLIEFFGGCLLIVGLFTRLASLLLTCEMGIAVWTMHSHQGLLAVSNYDFPLSLGVGAFALATTGAGLISLDRLLFKDKA